MPEMFIATANGSSPVNATLVLPPGDTDGAIGAKQIMIDSITAVYLATGSALSSGELALRKNSSSTGQVQLLDGITAPISSSTQIQLTFPNGGMPMPLPGTATSRQVYAAAVNAAKIVLTVQYHYVSG